ncbi:MAG: ABC transporter ATP-binding protein/permease [Lachnospiraceae bacterium]|nr:ABC transporter ATP-binding protein/permease [Lachnospiraceae bacterium]
MIKKLASYIGKYKKNTILAPVLMIMEVLMDTMIPYIMAMMINNGLEKGNGDLDYVIRTGVLMLVMSFGGLFFGVTSGMNAAIASTGLARNLRKALFSKVQGFSFENIDKFSSSSLITRLTSDVTNVQNTFQMIIRMCVRAPLMMVFALIMAFRLNAKLASLFVIAVPVLAVALYFIITNVHGFFKQMFKEIDNLNNDVQENLLNIRTVKAYVRESYEIDKFEKITAKISGIAVKAEKIMVIQMPIMMFVVNAINVLLSLIGGKFAISGEVEIGTLNSLFTYTMQILMSLMMVSFILVMLVMSIASAERITEVLNEESTLTNPENPVMEVKDGSIKFEHVNFAYEKGEDKNVLTDINIDIKSGQTVGIIGGTGSSKSTLVQLIPRLYDITLGSLKVGGVDVRDYDMHVLRDAVSMVLQKNQVFSGSVTANMHWGDETATQEEIKRACDLACASEFIEQWDDGYDYMIEQGGNNVSGGQKQRLCIARALLKKPKILILDDSTSAVDMKTDAMIREAFKNEIPDTTKIIIAQRIASVMDSDMIIVLEEGRVAGIGTHDELYKNNEIYREVYDSQVKGGDDDAA